MYEHHHTSPVEEVGDDAHDRRRPRELERRRRLRQPSGCARRALFRRHGCRRSQVGHLRTPKAPRWRGFRRDADERTRTSTELPPHGPEPCASTNSATSAGSDAPRIAEGLLPSCRPEPPSSRGLGRRPLTAETGVRIPVAVLRKRPEHGRFRRSGAVRDSPWDSRASVRPCGRCQCDRA
jgi:hypothetical protein